MNHTFSEVPQTESKPRQWASIIGGLFTLAAMGVALCFREVFGYTYAQISMLIGLGYSGSFTYLERYDGLVWVVLGTWGGSFETDKIYISNSKGITGIFNNTDLFKYVNYIRTTSKRGGLTTGTIYRTSTGTLMAVY